MPSPAFAPTLPLSQPPSPPSRTLLVPRPPPARRPSLARRARVTAQSSSPEEEPSAFPPPEEPIAPSYGEGAPAPSFKFDKDSDVDAFGRDPKKETDFWRAAANEVVASDAVREAVASHEADGGDGLTDEQRAYMEFVKSLDEGKVSREKREGDGQD